jgi:hypothetical protein
MTQSGFSVGEVKHLRPDRPSRRRRFLKRGAIAAGALALPDIIRASALGRDGAVAPSERIVLRDAPLERG